MPHKTCTKPVEARASLFYQVFAINSLSHIRIANIYGALLLVLRNKKLKYTICNANKLQVME